MHLPDFLEPEPAGASVRLAGHRVQLTDVVRLYNQGYGAELIAAHLPTVPLATIHKVIAFYLENAAEIDAQGAAEEAEMKGQEAAFDRTRTAPTLDDLRKRLDVMRRTGG